MQALVWQLDFNARVLAAVYVVSLVGMEKWSEWLAERRVVSKLCWFLSSYVNMDFIVFFSLVGSYMLSLFFLYDLICQWSRNLLKRMTQFPSYMQVAVDQICKAKFVLPKFHIYNHGVSCQLHYSLNYLLYSAQMNGEDPECWWSHINSVSMSTWEMGPGLRTDTINDHALAWNWQKITNFGESDSILFRLVLTIHIGNSLLSQLKKAIKMHVKHWELFNKFNTTFPEDVVMKWEQMLEEWNVDPNKPNPYEEPVASKL